LSPAPVAGCATRRRDWTKWGVLELAPMPCVICFQKMPCVSIENMKEKISVSKSKNLERLKDESLTESAFPSQRIRKAVVIIPNLS